MAAETTQNNDVEICSALNATLRHWHVQSYDCDDGGFAFFATYDPRPDQRVLSESDLRAALETSEESEPVTVGILPETAKPYTEYHGTAAGALAVAKIIGPLSKRAA